MKQIILITFLLVLAGCKGDTVEEKLSSWNHLLAENIQLGSDIKSVQKKLASLNIDSEYDSEENKLVFVLETIESSFINIVCSQWVILGAVNLNNNKQVVSYQAEQVGTCL